MFEQPIEHHLKAIRENVISIIDQFDFTMHRFATFTGVSAATLYKYREGSIHVNLLSILRISKAFGILPDRLVSLDGSIYGVIDKIKKDKPAMEIINKAKGK